MGTLNVDFCGTGDGGLLKVPPSMCWKSSLETREWVEQGRREVPMASFMGNIFEGHLLP